VKAQRIAAPAALATLAGVVLWGVASLLSHKREPWDASVYWVTVYPLAIAMSAVLAYRYPQRPVLWALVIFESQFLAMCIRSREAGNLWPIGMLLFAVVALPAIAAAKIAAARSPHANVPEQGAEVS
jgi:hypothetical protein